MDQLAYEREVADRAEQIIRAMSEHGGHSLWAAHALLAVGVDRDRITDIVRRDLDGFTLGLTGAGPFQILPAMLLLCRWERELPDEVVGMIRRFFLDGILERGNTENHWLMYYAGNLLAAERWADEPLFWNGHPPQVIHAEATRWILATIERTARIGHHEYDSPGYHIEHMAPLIGLYEHAQDAHLREQVERVLTLLVADMALEYFKGSWAGGHSREGYRQNTWTRSGPIQTLQHLYFGGEPLDPESHLHGFAIPAVVSSYRPPALFARMALDRTQPCVIRKTKAARTIFRHTDREAAPVRKYTYMSRSFALGSTQVGLPGAPAGPIDLVSWDLTWHGPKHQAKIGCNHPYQGPGRFSAFLNPLPQDARRAIGSGKPYLQRPDRLFGASPYERIMQHEGTVIVLYRIPGDDETPFVNLYLPMSVSWQAQNGWLFGDMGEFCVGIRPIGPYIWEHIRESANDSTMVSEGGLIDNWLLRILEPNAGLILEAVEAADADGFQAYCSRRAATGPDTSGWPHEGTVSVETFDGHRMSMTFDGPHLLDGEPTDYDRWPLYGAPGARAEVNTGTMVFGSGDEELVVDFGFDLTRPLAPMRVIG